jgi:hypothetical protein
MEPSMRLKKHVVIPLAVMALVLGGLWFYYFYYITCCAPPPLR